MEPITATFQLSDLARGLLGATALVGNLMGSPMGGLIADTLGRKTCMLVCWISLAIASTAQGLATNILSLCIWRIMMGWAVGAHYSGITAYLSETLPPHLITKLMSVVEAQFFVGNFTSLVAGAGFQSAGISWRLTLALPTIPTSLIIVWFYLRAPETPAWIQNHRVRNAQTQTESVATVPPEAISVQTSPATVDAVANQNAVDTSDQGMSVARAIVFTSIFWGSLIAPTFSVSAYAISIIETLDFHADAFKLNIVLGAAVGIGVFLGCGIVSAVGKKKLLLISQWGVAGSLAVMALLETIAGWHSLNQMAIRVAIGTAFIAFELLNGVGAPLALVYPAEIFPPRVKGFCAGISAMNSRIIGVSTIFICSLSLARLGVAGTVLFLGILSGIGALVTHLMAPPDLAGTQSSSKRSPQQQEPLDASHVSAVADHQEVGGRPSADDMP